MGALISAARAAFYTSRGPFAHLWSTPFEVFINNTKISIEVSLKKLVASFVT